MAHVAGRVISREKPLVVGVTGSVGKSSAKQALDAVLGAKFKVRSTPGNFNTEIGLPLTVLDLPSGGSSVWAWMGICPRARWRSLFKIADYPEILVLEMGADRPGDIDRLCDIAPPSIGVVTAVGESHLEKFKSLEAIEKEKGRLIERLPADGLAVLNRDDERVWAMRERTEAKVMSFGYHEQADVRVLPDSVNYVLDDERSGTQFKVSADGNTVPMFLTGVAGRHALYAAGAAVVVGLHKGLNLLEIADALLKYQPAPGRMRVLPGIKRSFLIDDTYNSAPKSVQAALALLDEMPRNSADDKKFAVLGDMLELGETSVAAHREVGAAAEKVADVLVFVGERMTEAEQAAREAGAGEERIFHFARSEEAGRFVQERMKRGDVILVKGSRGMEMERTVKELLATPMLAKQLLVKFHAEWEL